MRKGLPPAGEIIDRPRREEPKPAATAAVPSMSKRFKLSLPVDQRKRTPPPSRPAAIDERLSHCQICGQQWDRARQHTHTHEHEPILSRGRGWRLNNDPNDVGAFRGVRARPSLEITPVRLIAPRVRKQSRRRPHFATHANCEFSRREQPGEAAARVLSRDITSISAD